MPMHPQKSAEGHRSLRCVAVRCGTERSVIFCAFLWMYSGLLRAHGERARQADPLNACVRGVPGGKYLIAVSARTVCARRIDSRPLSCRRCQEPPSTTCRLLDRLTLGGSRHRRRNDSRARRASSTLAESRHRSFRSRWPGGTGLRRIPYGNDYNPAQSSTGRDRGRSAACGQLARTIAQAIPAS